MVTSRINRNTYGVLIIGMMLVFVLVLLLGIRVLLIFSYSVDLDGAEYVFVHHVQRMMSGLNLYTDPTLSPYLTTLYNPLYFFVYKTVCKWMQLDPMNDLHQIFIAGRSISFLFFLLEAGVLYHISSRLRWSVTSRLGILVLFMLLMTGHMFSVRMDSMKIFFYTLFLLFLVKYFFFGYKRSTAVFSVLSGVLCVMIKQDALVYILFAILLLFFFRPIKRVLVYSLIFMISLTIPYILFYKIWGLSFFHNTVGFNMQVVTALPGTLNMLVLVFSFIRTLPMLCIVILNAAVLYRQNKLSGPQGYWVTGAVASCLISQFLMLRPGAYLNYSYEWIIWGLINIILFKEYATENYPFRPIIKQVFTGAYFIFLLITGVLIHSYSYSATQEKEHKKLYLENKKKSAKVRQLIGEQQIFLPEGRLTIFFPPQQLFYGYEYHADRYIKVLVGMDVKSKLLFYSEKEHDQNFTNGNLPCIIIRDDPVQIDQMRKYYVLYKWRFSVQDWSVYFFPDHLSGDQ